MLKSQKRQYHVYGLASQVLKTTEQILIKEQQMLSLKKEKSVDRNVSLKEFIVRTKNSEILDRIYELDKSIEAAQNIQRLSNQAFEIGKQIRSRKFSGKEKISEELEAFIEITNESYPCFSKEDYDFYKSNLAKKH